MQQPVILRNSDKKTIIVNLYRVSLKVAAVGITRAPAGQFEAISMPWTNDIAQMVDLTFAQRFAIVGTRVLNSKEFFLMKHQADSPFIQN